MREFTHWLDGAPRATSGRQTVQPRLEALEDRVVPSAPAFAQQPPNPNQLYQQILQAEANPSPDQSSFLKNTLNVAVVVLPGISSFLNVASSNLNATFGPNLGQQYLNVGIQAVDSLLLNLERATLTSLLASGNVQDPTVLADAAVINAFVNNPLNYSPPV